MAYTGSGTAADPFVVDNWADCIAAANVRYDVYVKWADLPEGQKVVPAFTISSRIEHKAMQIDFNGWAFKGITCTIDFRSADSSNMFLELSFEDVKYLNWHIEYLEVKDLRVSMFHDSVELDNAYFDYVKFLPMSSSSTFWTNGGREVNVFYGIHFWNSVVRLHTEECNAAVPSGIYHNSELWIDYKYTGTTARKNKHCIFAGQPTLYESYLGGKVDVSGGTGSFAITPPHNTLHQTIPGAILRNSIINIQFLVSAECTISDYSGSAGSTTNFRAYNENIKSYIVTDYGNDQDSLDIISSQFKCSSLDIRNPEELTSDSFPYIHDDDVRYPQYGGESPNLFPGGLEVAFYNPATGEYQSGVTGWISAVNIFEVSPNTTYTFSVKNMPLVQIGLFTYEYDKNMGYLGYGVTTTSAELTCRTFTTGSTTKYVRFSITGVQTYGPSDFGDFNVNIGDEQQPYLPYGYRVDQDWRWRQNVYINDGVPFLPFYFYPVYEPPVIYPIERADPIIVYDILEPQDGFDHNGLAILFPSEVISYKEDMGRWDLELTHPIDQYGKWSYIVGQNTVKVNGQIFRIDETELYVDANQRYIKAHANHITYDLNDKFVGDASFTVSTGLAYEAQIMLATREMVPSWEPTPYEYDFELTSDITGTLVADVHDQTVTGALYGDDNSFANRYGGHLYRDNFHLSINTVQENLPATPAFQLRYGTDLTKISYKIDFSSWITELVCENNFGELWAVTYEGSEWIIHHHKTKRIHFTYPPGTPDTLQTLIKDGEAYWATVSTPKVSIEVAVANLKNDPKYKDFIDLQNLDVGYTGTVYFEQFGIDIDLKIVSIRRNELTGEAIQIVLGNAPNSLIRSPVMSQTIVPNSSVESKQAQTVQAMQEEIENVKIKSMRLWSGIRAYTWADVRQYKWEEIKNGRRDS